MTGNLHIPSATWLAELFECEYCAECRGDAEHHTALPVFGNWFARCDHGPSDDGTPHLIIQAFHRTAGRPELASI